MHDKKNTGPPTNPTIFNNNAMCLCQTHQSDMVQSFVALKCDTINKTNEK